MSSLKDLLRQDLESMYQVTENMFKMVDGPKRRASHASVRARNDGLAAPTSTPFSARSRCQIVVWRSSTTASRW